jgi:hypothetical protein
MFENMGQARAVARANERHRTAVFTEETAWQIKRNAAPKSVIANLSRIPGVGPSIAADLYLLGIRDVGELRGRSPESLYGEMCRQAGQQDRCLLYVFRCAIYYASAAKPEPEMLKWWNWKDDAPAAAAAGVRPVNSRKSRIR